MRLVAIAASFILMLLAGPALSAQLDTQSINTATFSAKDIRGKPRGPRASLVKAQILLDRAGYSPGEIDGRHGDNFAKALAAFQADHGLPSTGELDQASWDSLAGTTQEPAVTDYEITRQDLRGPFTKRIPVKFEAMAHLRRLGYRNVEEELAEKFHISPELLKAMNPRERFKKPGDTITVAAVAQPDLARVKANRQAPLPGSATRLEIDKDRLTLKAFDATGRLLHFFPASVGSEDKPAPSGTLEIERVNLKPDYTYNPKYAFKGVKARHPFTIAPGPNNPVGLVWIDLNAEGDGIHGTPDPGRISKRYSHGCIRLTNWDALTLATLVRQGVPVTFIGNGPQPAAADPTVDKAD
ncbi:murein L,D-transpeptidase [Labrys miyagiensis]|uniref:Murein L,D-transpeptidase n=1 Tax=Labrys miyagiensis TaxID=346912 RepID=A0ABQ6CFW0_9HYPH|nr:L,D-transpeptidase [Labrys miyagiensis]GLS17181.1 murein L,D-transpeptidase [Labrys miyagiensis]